MDAAVAIGLVGAGYAAGAIPWGLLLGRWLNRTDLRQHGSGATGATNALRVLGWRISLAVLLLDFLKGFFPVLIGRQVGMSGWVIALVGLATVVGHCWSPFIQFRGGKGMATGAGAAAGLFPWVLLVFPLMLLIVVLTRYVSLASLVGSLTVSVVVIALGIAGLVGWSIITAIVGITIIIIVKHRSNILRLINGTERRFGESANTPTSTPSRVP